MVVTSNRLPTTFSSFFDACDVDLKSEEEEGIVHGSRAGTQVGSRASQKRDWKKSVGKREKEKWMREKD
jgi:hypothetical protein